jgi:uncharacterized membrane protein YczE
MATPHTETPRRPLDLTPVSVRTDAGRRFGQLFGGLTLYALSMGLMIRGHVGLAPWDVFHQGVAKLTGFSFGTVTALTGLAVLLAWLPIRQRPGVGTVANVIVIAVVVDIALDLLPAPVELGWRIPMFLSGVVLNGVATAAYVGARLGPGPRDGLMTGICARFGGSVRVVRTSIEVVVLAAGWLLGGNVGLGTVCYAVAIGPLTQFFLRFLAYRSRP